MRGICTVFARYLHGICAGSVLKEKSKIFMYGVSFARPLTRKNYTGSVLQGIRPGKLIRDRFCDQIFIRDRFCDPISIRDWFCDPQSLQISKRRRTKVPKVPKVPEFHA